MKLNLIFLVPILLFSCDDKDAKDPNCGHGTCEYDMITSASLQIDSAPDGPTLIQVNEGGNIVFKWTKVHPDNKNIADDELTEVVYFQVPSDLESFNYQDDELAHALLYYARYCYCGDYGFLEVTSGTLSGTRLDSNSWQIEGDLLIDGYFGSYTVAFHGIFRTG